MRRVPLYGLAKIWLNEDRLPSGELLDSSDLGNLALFEVGWSRKDKQNQLKGRLLGLTSYSKVTVAEFNSKSAFHVPCSVSMTPQRFDMSLGHLFMYIGILIIIVNTNYHHSIQYTFVPHFIVKSQVYTKNRVNIHFYCITSSYIR